MKLYGKRPFVRPQKRWKLNITMCLTEVVSVKEAGTGSESCPMARFGISAVKSASSTTRI